MFDTRLSTMTLNAGKKNSWSSKKTPALSILNLRMESQLYKLLWHSKNNETDNKHVRDWTFSILNEKFHNLQKSGHSFQALPRFRPGCKYDYRLKKHAWTLKLLDMYWMIYTTSVYCILAKRAITLSLLTRGLVFALRAILLSRPETCVQIGVNFYAVKYARVTIRLWQRFPNCIRKWYKCDNFDRSMLVTNLTKCTSQWN